MIRACFIFLILLGSIYLGIQLRNDPGYVLIAIHHWTIETTLGVALLLLFLLFTLFHTLLLMLRWFTRLPKRWKLWRKKRNLLEAHRMTRQGLIEFSEGQWMQAKRHLMKALSDTDTPLINYLTAARAAQEMGDNQLRDDYLREAQHAMPEATIAVRLTQAQLQLENHQWEQALATLKHLQSLAPHHPYVLKLLMQLYKEVRDWPQLIALLPELKHRKVLENHAYLELQKEAYYQAVLDLIKYSDEVTLSKWIKDLPSSLKTNPNIISTYCYYLINNNKAMLAEPLLKKALNKQFDEKLITCYGLIHPNDQQLHFAESLLKNNPSNASLLLCLARLNRSKQLWGKAKHYYEESIQKNPTTEAFLELGELLEELNDEKRAALIYRQGLLRKD